MIVKGDWECGSGVFVSDVIEWEFDRFLLSNPGVLIPAVVGIVAPANFGVRFNELLDLSSSSSIPTALNRLVAIGDTYKPFSPLSFSSATITAHTPNPEQSDTITPHEHLLDTMNWLNRGGGHTIASTVGHSL